MEINSGYQYIRRIREKEAWPKCAVPKTVIKSLLANIFTILIKFLLFSRSNSIRLLFQRTLISILYTSYISILKYKMISILYFVQ